MQKGTVIILDREDLLERHKDLLLEEIDRDHLKGDQFTMVKKL